MKNGRQATDLRRNLLAQKGQPVCLGHLNLALGLDRLVQFGKLGRERLSGITGGTFHRAPAQRDGLVDFAEPPVERSALFGCRRLCRCPTQRQLLVEIAGLGADHSRYRPCRFLEPGKPPRCIHQQRLVIRAKLGKRIAQGRCMRVGPLSPGGERFALRFRRCHGMFGAALAKRFKPAFCQPRQLFACPRKLLK